MSKFIYIFDKSDADKMVKLGYNLLSHQNGAWVFLNDGRTVFAEVATKYVFSNSLSFV